MSTTTVAQRPARRTFRSAPTVEAIEGMPCPVARAARIGQIARDLGTLPRSLARLRVQALIAARRDGHGVGFLAAELGLSQPRISQLTAHAFAEVSHVAS